METVNNKELTKLIEALPDSFKKEVKNFVDYLKKLLPLNCKRKPWNGEYLSMKYLVDTNIWLKILLEQEKNEEATD